MFGDSTPLDDVNSYFQKMWKDDETHAASLKFLEPEEREVIREIGANNWEVHNPVVVSVSDSTYSDGLMLSVPFVTRATRMLVLGLGMGVTEDLIDVLHGTDPIILPSSFITNNIIPEGKDGPRVHIARCLNDATVRECNMADIVLYDFDRLEYEQFRDGKCWTDVLQPSLFDLIVVHKAHDLSTTKWSLLVEHFATAKLLFFTNSPRVLYQNVPDEKGVATKLLEDRKDVFEKRTSKPIIIVHKPRTWRNSKPDTNNTDADSIQPVAHSSTSPTQPPVYPPPQNIQLDNSVKAKKRRESKRHPPAVKKIKGAGK